MLTTSKLMTVAEAAACAALAGMCVALAIQGHHIAWLFGFGSLTYAWDLRRRVRRQSRSTAR